MTRYTDFLSTRGRIVLAAAAVVMAASAFGITQLQIQTEFDVFMPPESERLAAMEKMSAAFGDSDQLLAIAHLGPAEPYTAADSSEDAQPNGTPPAALPEIAQQLSEIDGVVTAESPLPEYMLELPERQRALMMELLQSSGAADSSLPVADGERYGVFRLLLASDASYRHVIDQVRVVFESRNLSLTLSGAPYLEAEVFSMVLRIIVTIPPAAIVLMLLVFRLRIGSFRATVLSLVPAAVGAVVTLGAVSAFSGSVSIVTVLVPIFVIVLGSADGLHVTSHVIDELADGKTNRQAVESTLRKVGVPIIMTTVTTMAGFLSLLVINSAAMRELGVAAATGILIAGIATWLILPTILLHQKPLPRHSADRSNRLVGALAKLRGLPAVLIAVTLIAATIPGALRLNANFSMIDVYRPNTEVRRSLDKAGRLLGGSIPVYATFPAGDGTATASGSSAAGRAVLELQQRTEEAGIAGTTVSAYSLTAGIPSRMLPATIRNTINSALTDGFFARSPETNENMGRAVFFLRDLDDTTLTEFQEIAAEISGTFDVPLTLVGTPFVIQEMNAQIIPQQMSSLALAIVLVLVLTVITQRSLKLGVISTVPIVITLVTLFGVMGYARIDLSVITGIMTGLTVGVGIDYAIHFVSMLRYTRRTGSEAPVAEAFGYVATPVLANALGLAVGFTAMITSPLQIHVTLSILMWVTMIASAVLSLTLLPTIAGRGGSADSTGRGWSVGGAGGSGRRPVRTGSRRVYSTKKE